ncbi:MAG: hypothetical protein GXY61_08685, partial [Lentisphaerae bacterium]|nr:hypothetical protein [Lentisphaerota bacterium]
EPVGVAEPGVASVKLSGFPESCTGSSAVLLSAVTAILTVAVRVSGSPKSSIAVPVGTDISVSPSGANAIISPFVPIEASASFAIAEIGNMVRTMHTESQILKILFLTLSLSSYFDIFFGQ